MSRVRNFSQGVSVGLAIQAVMVVAGLWMLPFLLQRLGSHEYGLWLVASQVVAYLALLDFGVLGLLPRDTAVAAGAQSGGHEGPTVSDVIGRSARLLLYLQPLLAVVALGVWLSMPDDWRDLKRPLGVLFMAFVILFPTRLLIAALQGLQDQAYAGWATVAGWGVTTMVTIVLILRGLRLDALAIAWTAGQVVTALMAFSRLHRRHTEVLPRRLPSITKEIRDDYLRRGGWTTLSSISHMLLVGTDVLIIAKIVGPAAVVPYVVTAKLMSVLANQPHLLMQVALPGLAEMRGQADRQRIFLVSAALGQLMLLMSGAVLVVVLLVNSTFVSWWVGPQQYGGPALTVALLLVMTGRHWNATMSYTVFSLGNERQIAIVNMIDGLVTVGAGALLVWAIGPLGAPLGALLGIALVSAPRYLAILSREFGMSRGALLAPLAPWAWRTAVIAMVAAVIGWRPGPVNFLYLALAASIGGLVYIGFQWSVALRPPLGSYLAPRIQSLRARFGSVSSDG